MIISIVINIIVFVLINFYGLKFLLGGGKYQVKPAIGKGLWKFTGAEMFVLLTLGCAMLSASFGGMLALRLLLWVILVAVGIGQYRARGSWVAFLYGVYYLWLVIGLTYTPWVEFGLRQLAKYSLPLLLVLFVPRVIKHREIFHKGVYLVFVSFMIWAILSGANRLGMGFLTQPIIGVYWWAPAILDSYGVILSICVVRYCLYRDRRVLWILPLICVIPAVGYVVRTAFVVLLVASMAMAFFRYKLLSLPYVVGIIVLGIALVVLVPGIREKMFYKDYSSNELVSGWGNMISFDSINTNGRFLTWERLLDLFYHPHPLTGSGLGCQQKFMYAQKDTGWGAGIAHCDYVQILCDSGLIGIILYALTSTAFIISCFFMYNNQTLSFECRYAAFIAGVSLCGLLAAMMTDNVVNYTMTTLAFPYTFYGIALGIQRLDKSSKSLQPSVDYFHVQCNHTFIQ